MFKRLAATPLIAGAIIVLTTAAASAFSQQTVTPNGNYNFDLGDKTKLDGNTNKSDPNSQGFHFSIQSGQMGGFHSFGSSGNDRPPDYWAPLGRGN